MPDRSDADLELDLAVALGIEGYRWVEWNAAALREAPLYEQGRFIGHPGDMVAQHYVEALAGSPLADHPYRRLPPYGSDAGLALRAAERAGLFRGQGVRLSASPTGRWSLRRSQDGEPMEDDALPRLLCRAGLRCVDETSAREEG